MGLNENYLNQALVGLDLLFTDEKMQNELIVALKDDTGEVLAITALSAVDGSDEWNDEEIDNAIKEFCGLLAVNANLYLQKFIEFGGGMKKIFSLIRETVKAEPHLADSFTAEETAELIKGIYTKRSLELSQVDKLTGYYFVVKILAPELLGKPREVGEFL